MVRQVNAVLCSEVGGYSTTHWCLYDQSVPPTGKVFWFYDKLVLCPFILKGKKGALFQLEMLQFHCDSVFIFRLQKSLVG